MWWIWNRYKANVALEADVSRLLDRVRDLETEKVILEDRLQASILDREHLWGLVMKSIEDMKIAYQMHINREWQKMGEAAPYPEAPHMGDGQRFKAPENPFINRPMMGSEAVQAVTQKFISDYFQKQDG